MLGYRTAFNQAYAQISRSVTMKTLRWPLHFKVRERERAHASEGMLTETTNYQVKGCICAFMRLQCTLPR